MFDQYPNAKNLEYVQGSSGFAGFAKDRFTQAQIEDFDRNMRGMFGNRWLEWGTEQTASNFAIANSPGAIVLPYQKYANFGPECYAVGLHNCVFLHFFRHVSLPRSDIRNVGTKRSSMNFFLIRET